MEMLESVAYLKGLAEGLDIEPKSKEGKLFSAIIDVLDDLAYEINGCQECNDELHELVDIIDEDLGKIEEDFYDLEDMEDEEDPWDCDDGLYEVTCPKCGDVVYLDEEMVGDDGIDCPNCGQQLEFDLSDCDCCKCGDNHNHADECGCDCDDECDCDCEDGCDCDDDCTCGCKD
ncbi:MAG: hypothetical protein RR497_03355 [Oscillospiraceae bacterium]